MVRITDILEKASQYLNDDDLEMIEKAYIFSATVHQGQIRLSGEPYLVHPIEVTGILVEMRMDAATIITGLLHDTVEDTLTTVEQIEEAFGKDVAFLVDGLTKLGKIKFKSQIERQAENFRKMILAMSSDIRLLIVRLADRIHNMRTLGFQSREKQRFIARETLEVHAPLAGRLGIHWMKVELEDLAFKYFCPEEYSKLAERVAKKKDERKNYTQEVIGIIRKSIEEFDIEGKVEGRAKHFYSIFKKMREQHINFDEVYDLTAFRIILASNEVRKCYETLSVIHALWKPVPGRFKDYIAMPKQNNYRSLHTTVIGPYGERVEVQIRTQEMHEWAEKGIAAHWRYKEGKASAGEDEAQVNKLRELLIAQQEHKNAREFMSNLKLALFPDEVYVFTPKGDVKSFPKGATPIDFAYSVHSDVGDHCIGAKINRSIVPLKYELQNGDTVEIITQTGHNPSKDWLKYAVTTKAKSKIRYWIKTQEREKSINLGKDILEKECRKLHLQFNQITKTDEFKKLLEEQSLTSVDELLALVGYGKMSARHVCNRFIPEEPKKKETLEKEEERKKTKTDTGVKIEGIDDVMLNFAHCCNPLPGDDIIGYITRGRGITVHVATCPDVRKMDMERLIEVEWNIEGKQTFPVNIRVFCKDEPGLLAELSGIISSLGINIKGAHIDTITGHRATCDFSLDIKDVEHLNDVFSALRHSKNVISVERMRGLLQMPKKKKSFH